MNNSRGPDMRKYLNKQVVLKLNGKRKIRGFLRGFDVYMNLVVDQAVHVLKEDEVDEIGKVVIRGNSILELESLDRV
eukprot:maker-scaffold_7-snap-gene-10.26-mRNA-1 protein AED:0.01 eAED:0.01 QI:90/1/1/1/1/1/3/1406/76